MTDKRLKAAVLWKSSGLDGSINTAAAFLLRGYFVFNASNFCFNSARAFSISS